MAAAQGRAGAVQVLDEAALRARTNLKDPTLPELLGSGYAPRLRWTCKRCHRRQDSSLGAPLRKIEIVVCRYCHRGDAFTFTEKSG